MMLARMIKIFFVIKMLKIGLGAAASAEVLNVAGETPATHSEDARSRIRDFKRVRAERGRECCRLIQRTTLSRVVRCRALPAGTKFSAVEKWQAGRT